MYPGAVEVVVVEVLAGGAMVVTMSRRIAAALCAQIARQRPKRVTDDDDTGKIEVVTTGAGPEDELLQSAHPHKQVLRH